MGSLMPNERDLPLDERLRKLCSDMTLQQKKEGFFGHLMEQVFAYISEEFLDKFGELKTDEERLLKAWLIQPQHTLKVQSFFKSKNATVSEQKRTEGNKAFQEKKDQEALMLYSQSVMRAPCGSGTQLSLALANRSAVLFHKEDYDLCISDIQLALENGYPAHLKYKVLERQAQCHVKLGEVKAALRLFQETLESLEGSNLEPKKKLQWKKDMEEKIQQLQSAQGSSSASQGAQNVGQGEGQDGANRQDEDLPDEGRASAGRLGGRQEGGEEEEGGARKRKVQNVPALLDKPSKAMPSASCAVTLKEAPGMGRYAVAAQEIEPGDTLVTEKPFASVLMPDKFGSNCQNCYSSLTAPVPCTECSGVAFCSPGCRDEALGSYHRWECPFLDLLDASGMSLNCYLALRMVTKHDLEFFKKIKPRLHEARTSSLSSNELPSSSKPHLSGDYLSVYNLVALDEERGGSDFFQRTMMACFLLKVLQRAHYFGKWDEEAPPDASLTEDQILIGSLLLRHLQVLQFNAHEVSGFMHQDGQSYKHSKSLYLGLGVYPTVSFFNHSCFPAVSRYFVGNRIVVQALRSLRPGEVLAENYGPVFTHQPREERHKKLLARYWFKCGCEACDGGWPTYTDMQSQMRLRCESCGISLPAVTQGKPEVKCSKCGVTWNALQLLKRVTEAHQTYKEGIEKMDKGLREEAIRCLSSYISVVSKALVRPYKDLHLAMEALRLLIAARSTRVAFAKKK